MKRVWAGIGVAPTSRRMLINKLRLIVVGLIAFLSIHAVLYGENKPEVTTVRGKVTAVKNTDQGVELRLKTETDDVLIDIGPRWYVNRQAVNVGVGDQVMVIGLSFRPAEFGRLLAREIRKEDQPEVSWKIRDDQGRLRPVAR